MYYIYVLRSEKNGTLYTGYTEDLKRRLKEHNEGHGSIYSSKNRPFSLVFYEAFFAKEDAAKQELFYKSGYGRDVLKEKIKNSLDQLRV